MKELSEKSEVLQQEEQQKKSWEIKAAASEKQIEQLQVRQALPACSTSLGSVPRRRVCVRCSSSLGWGTAGLS